jgi:hypothetical protein
VEFVFYGAADPTGEGAVVVSGASADFLEEFGREADGDHFGEFASASPGWALGGLVLGVGVELVFFLAAHLVGHRSSRYRSARCLAAM